MLLSRFVRIGWHVVGGFEANGLLVKGDDARASAPVVEHEADIVMALGGPGIWQSILTKFCSKKSTRFAPIILHFTNWTGNTVYCFVIRVHLRKKGKFCKKAKCAICANCPITVKSQLCDQLRLGVPKNSSSIYCELFLWNLR